MFKKIIVTVVVALTLVTPVFVSAQGLKDAGKILDKAADSSKTGLSSDLPTVVATVIKAVLALVGTVFLVLTIYAGILWMTAQGEEEKVTKAKEIIKASIIGLVIIMSAYAITYFVTSRLTGATTGSEVPVGSEEISGCCYDTSYTFCTDEIDSACDDEGSGTTIWQSGMPCSSIASCPSP